MALRRQRRFAGSGQPRGVGWIRRQELSPGARAHLPRSPFSEDQGETWPWWKRKDLHGVSWQWPLSARVCSSVYWLAAPIPHQAWDFAGCLPGTRLRFVSKGQGGTGAQLWTRNNATSSDAIIDQSAGLCNNSSEAWLQLRKKPKSPIRCIWTTWERAGAGAEPEERI